LDLGKNTQKIKPKPAGHSTAVRTAHTCVLITVYNCGTQYRIAQFW